MMGESVEVNSRGGPRGGIGSWSPPSPGPRRNYLRTIGSPRRRSPPLGERGRWEGGGKGKKGAPRPDKPAPRSPRPEGEEEEAEEEEEEEEQEEEVEEGGEEEEEEEEEGEEGGRLRPPRCYVHRFCLEGLV